ncbi:hypothetical protein HMPREF3226_01466 [Prevotella corporis]|uniref:Uncharacterized protein n=1 Tax=Prevotella corporis TaxID=28128 RepID=A0A133Q7B1_9BACT|nr:hypothetical protein HMPREF3226_01466 [Prevotella corporis]
MDKNSIFFYLSKIHRENIILMNEIWGRTIYWCWTIRSPE